jgi:hypothetical protein
MTEPRQHASTGLRLNPAMERLFSKITDLDELLEEFQAQDLTHDQKQIVKICQAYLEKAREYINCPLISAGFPFIESRHPHLVWELLHRVDEYFVLLIKPEELHSRAIDVKTAFDLNIKEEKVRAEWIGANGKLVDVLDQIKKKQASDEHRYVIRDALKLVNEQMDRTFWILSMNTLTSVWSGIFLGILLFLCWFAAPICEFNDLWQEGLCINFATLIVLGLMGSYLSNLMTNENFLYIRGGPFWRYFLHNLLTKPLMSAFATVFIFILEKSKLIFSINIVAGTQSPHSAAASQIISLNVTPEGAGYAYAVLAIVSGFAADKILRNMIDSVLKKLEQKAEKTKDSEKK